MASARIVKLVQEDSEEPILLHIKAKREYNLDLDITATEGEAVYKGKIRFKKLADIRSQNSDVSTDDLAAILRFFFVSKVQSGISDAQRHSLEVVGSVKGKRSKTMTITFRNRIEGITQKIAAIELLEADEEVSFLEWTSMMVDKQTEAEDQLSSLRQKSEADQQTISNLRAQLEAFVQAKSTHETQLLTKFSMLLNEKKVKIRNQQRVFRTASGVNRAKMHELQSSINGDRSEPKSSKARKHDQVDTTDRSSSEGFEDMDIDAPAAEALSRESSRQTTPGSETASDSEVLDNLRNDVSVAGNVKTTQAESASKKAATSPPPTRGLPFTQQNAKNLGGPPDKDSIGSDDETASEDDEL